MKRLFHRSRRQKGDSGATHEQAPPGDSRDHAQRGATPPTGTAFSLDHRSALSLTTSTDYRGGRTFSATQNGRRKTPPGNPPPVNATLQKTTPVTLVTKKDYWQLAVEKLQEEDASITEQIAGVQQAAAAAGTTDFAAQLLQTTQQSKEALEAKRWKISTGSQDIVLRDRFDRLLKVLMGFKDVGAAAGMIDPLHAGLPLAGLCVLMQMATTDSEQYAAMVAGVEEIVTIVAYYQHIEALYLARPDTTLKQNFERHLVSLYKRIIRYQISATCYYRRNTMVRFLRAIPKLDDMSEVMSAIRRDNTACREIRQVFDSSDASERHRELLQKFDQFEKSLASQHIQGANSQSSHVHWAVARSSNALFTGREDILRDLETNIRSVVHNGPQQNQCRIVISGMGGQGKSEICLQLAQRVRSLFWGVFWIDVGTRSLAENGFLDIASRLKIPVQTWEDGRQGLANIQRPWMLVLDNADDPSIDYQHYFPADPFGVVVLTSRNQECEQYATVQPIALERLPTDEGRELLMKAARVADDQRQALKHDADEVAVLLQSHPLALIQAGAYVGRGHCTLAEYPDVYGRQRKRLLAFRPSQAQSRYRDVYATFEATVEILQAAGTESARDALSLLPVLAVCGPSRLPLRLFEAGWTGAQRVPQSRAADDAIRLTQWHVSHLPSLVQADADEQDTFRLVEAVHILKVFALVSTDMHDGQMSVSMHPLVHAWARDRQDQQQQHDSGLKMACLVATSRSDGDFWRTHGRQLQHHVNAVTSWKMGSIFGSEPKEMIMCILTECGWLLHDMRDDTNLFMLLNELFIHLGLDKSTVSERQVEVYDLRARNLANYGKVEEAVKLQEQVVKIRERTLAEDHPHRLASQHVLAIVYQANGQVKDAVRLQEQVVKIRERTLAEDHPHRLTSQHELARAYQANGQVKDAVRLQEYVVKIRERTLAEDHPDRLASQHVLARIYQANGQVKDAVRLQEQVVKIHERTLAEDHPHRLASQHELAMVYQANGQVKDAVKLQEQVVKIRERTLAEDHPDRLASQHVLAIVYQANGQVKDAVKLQEQVVKICERTLAEDHPDRLASQHVLAMVYQANGQVKDAVKLQEQVVKICERTLAQDHPDRLASQHELARAYQANGQVKDAVKLLKYVVKIRERTLAEDHPHRLDSQHLLATMFWNLGRQKAALQLMQHVIEVQRKVLDEHHPDRENSEAWLAYFQKNATQMSLES